MKYKTYLGCIVVIINLICISIGVLPELARADSSRRFFYVATNGNDQWSGTLPTPSAGNDGPFVSLQRARDAIRELRQNGSKDAFTVFVRGGVYQLNETLVLEPEDSGTDSHPLIFCAFGNEQPILRGTRNINKFEPYKGKILKADLKGIVRNSVKVRQLFAHGKRQVLARYPNLDLLSPVDGFLYVVSSEKLKSKRTFNYQDGSLREWASIKDAEVIVYPGNNWTKNIRKVSKIDKNSNTITLSSDTTHDIKPTNRYFFQNLLEELDIPGEWYFDRSHNLLYYWPVDSKDLRAVTIPILKTILEIKRKEYKGKYYGTPANIRFKGFTLEGCDDSAIVVKEASKTVIAGCTIRNAGGSGIEINEGFDNAAIGNDIYEIGGAGIVITGGDTHNLTPARNCADNNYIHHIGVLQISSGILCKGVGNIISHNLIHSTPRVGIWFDGNDHFIEYNHVHHVNKETEDSGIIYSSQHDWTKRGNLIRFNYLHDSGGYGRTATGKWETSYRTYGIYLDDWTSGTKVYGNIVSNTPHGGVIIHGGRDNCVENNIIINGGRIGQMVYSGYPFTHADGLKWIPVMFEKVKKTRYTNYPSLETIKDPNTGAKMSGNVFLRNIVYYADRNASLYGIYNDIDLATTKSDNNIIYHRQLPVLIPFTKVPVGRQWNEWQNMGLDRHSLIADPMFYDVANKDFRLSSASPALKMGFKPIPYDKIGPYKDLLRASWPIMDSY